jgi:hypothetical protein
MMAAFRRSPMRLWSPGEETRLLIWAMTGKPLADFARAVDRAPGCVRTKLYRLRANPLTRPPEFTERDQPDAAAPRVKVACGPADTPDGT